MCPQEMIQTTVSCALSRHEAGNGPPCRSRTILALTALLLALGLPLRAAGDNRSDAGGPLVIDVGNGEVRMVATFNARAIHEPTSVGIAGSGTTGPEAAIFTTPVDPKTLYGALRTIGLERNAPVQVTISWNGRTRPFREIVRQLPERDLELAFTGDIMTLRDRPGGRLLCLDACPDGVISGPTRDDSSATGGAGGFYAVRDALPADGEPVVVTVSRGVGDGP